MYLKMTKTIVILLGNCRGGEDAWKSMYKHLLEPLNADLGMVVSEKDNQDDISLFKKAKYIRTVPEYTDWGDSIDNIMNEVCETPYDWRNDLKMDCNIWGGVHHGNNKPLGGSGAIVFSYRYQVCKLILENDLLSKYDRFVITRTDHFYEFKHPNLDNDHIWIPTGEEYGGICDRHFIANKSDVIPLLNIVPYILKNKYHQKSPSPEVVLRDYLKNIGIFDKVKKFPRNCYLVKRKNEQQRWCGQSKELPNGLIAKYIHEYNSAIKNKQIV